VATTVRRQDSSNSGLESARARTAILVLNGDYWTVGYAGKTFSLKASKGLAYIHRLLWHPGEEFHALDLLSGPDSNFIPEGASAETSSTDSNLTVGRLGDAGEMLDSEAKHAYKRRLSELKEQLEDQQERGNSKRAAEIESEIDFLLREISRAVGLGGRDRRAGSAAERARLNVTRAIKTALQKISEHQAELGGLLDHSVRTGLFCCYVADPHAPISWQFSLEGIKAPVEVAGATAPLLLRSETDFLRELEDQTRFVGREEERTSMRRYLGGTRRGEGRVLMIGGQPGVGKTRIAKEFGAEAAQRGYLTLAGGCYDREDSVPFCPFVEVLEALAQAPNQAAFRAALGHDAAELTRLMPQLRRMFPDTPRPLELSPDQTRESRRLLFNAFRGFLARNASDRPVFLLIEDLQWADEGTLSLLNHLVRSIAEIPVMIVGTYRDIDVDAGGLLVQTLDEMTRLNLSERISLRGLSRNEVAEMIQALSGREPPPAVVTLIFSNTEGNPFFVEELYRHLAERGELTDSNGEFLRDLKLADVDVPQDLRLAIGRRLARLGGETQKILGTAAVIGRSFTFDLLEAATGVDADLLLDRVEEVEKAGLISATLQFPEARFQFSHELIRNAVLNDLSAPRRQRLHIHIAEAIERVYSAELEDHANDLAHHLWQAGKAADVSKTIRYLEIAAKQAITRSANVEAIGHFRNALELIKTSPASPDRLRQELTLNTALGSGLVATKGFSSREVGRVFARARELSQQVGETPQLFHALWGLWINYASHSEYAAGFELAEQCLRLAQTSGDSSLLVEGHHALGVSCITAGEFARGLEHLEQVAAIYNLVDHNKLRFVFGQDPAVACLFHAGWALWFLGYPDQALKRNDESIALARRLKHPATMAMAAAFGSLPYQLCRDSAAVEKLTTEAVTVSTEHDMAFYRGIGVILGGWALTQRGVKEEGIARMRLGLDAFRAADAVLMLSYFSAVLAEVYLEIGQAGEGLRVLDAIDGIYDRYWVSEIHRLRGELILKQQEGAEAREAEAKAEECFRQAMATAREQNAKSLELRVAISTSRLRIRQGRCPEGLALMTETLGWFTEGFATPDLREAKRLLEDLRDREAPLCKTV
jgi:tetratricopeptide (TPR) repeat protein